MDGVEIAGKVTQEQRENPKNQEDTTNPNNATNRDDSLTSIETNRIQGEASAGGKHPQ